MDVGGSTIGEPMPKTTSLASVSTLRPVQMNVKKSPLIPGDEPMRTSGSWAKSNERILVIADSEGMREHLVEILSPEGFVVFEQPSAIGATR